MFIPGGAGVLPSYHSELPFFTTIWENMCVLLVPSASKSIQVNGLLSGIKGD